MSKTISDAIAEIQEEIGKLEEQARPLKLRVNVLCQIEGIPEVYPEAAEASPTRVKPKGLRLRVDEFTGMQTGKAVRRYLEMRKAADPENGPAKIEDIRAALLEGGFDFKGRDETQALSISLGKSTHTFKRLNNDFFGLAEWYGLGRASRGKTDIEEESEEEEVAPETGKFVGESVQKQPEQTKVEGGDA